MLLRSRTGMFVLLLGAALVGCRTDDSPRDSASKPQGQTLDPRARILITQAHQSLAAGDYQEALSTVDEIERYHPSIPEAVFIRGHVALAMGRLLDARRAFRSILARFPNYEAAWHSLGDVAYAEEKYREALTFYLREEAQNPTPETWYNIGNTYRMLDRPDSAALAYQAATRMSDAYAPAHYALADLLEVRGQFDDALPSAQRATTLNPAEPRYRYMLGDLLFKTGRLDEAEEVLREAARVAPWDHSTLYTLGQVLQRRGKGDEAAQFLARAEEARERESEVRAARRRAAEHRDSAMAHVALAEEFLRAGRNAEALERYRLAHAIDPGDLTVQQNIASLLLSEGDPDRAIERCRAILAADSTRVGAWVILSAAHARRGARQESAAAWARALSIDPNHPTVQQVLRSN